MKLFLVQHGEAKNAQEDPERPLNALGIAHANRVARFLAAQLGEVVQIQHSGKKRAEQTAELMAAYITPRPVVSAVAGLAPNDDVLPMAENIMSQQHTLMIVGHLPFLSHLAAQLLLGRPDREPVLFRNAGVVCFEYDDGRWRLNWSLVPELLPD